MDQQEGPFISMFDAIDCKWMESVERIEMGNISKEQEEKYAERFMHDVVVNSILNIMLKR